MKRKIIFAELLDQNHIQFEFSTFEKKTLDLTLLWQYPVFQFLKDEMKVSTFINKGSYLIWPEYEADLSADTIWHMAI